MNRHVRRVQGERVVDEDLGESVSCTGNSVGKGLEVRENIACCRNWKEFSVPGDDIFKGETGERWKGGFLCGSVVKHLPPNDETWVQSLMGEDPTCHRAITPVHHNCWTCAPQPRKLNSWSLHVPEPELCKEGSHCNEKPPRHERKNSHHTLQLEKSLCSSESLVQPKINKISF